MNPFEAASKYLAHLRQRDMRCIAVMQRLRARFPQTTDAEILLKIVALADEWCEQPPVEVS